MKIRVSHHRSSSPETDDDETDDDDYLGYRPDRVHFKLPGDREISIPWATARRWDVLKPRLDRELDVADSVGDGHTPAQCRYRLETEDSLPPFSNGRGPLLIHPEAWDLIVRPGIVVRAEWTASNIIRDEWTEVPPRRIVSSANLDRFWTEVPPRGIVSSANLDRLNDETAPNRERKQNKQRHVGFEEPSSSQDEVEMPPISQVPEEPTEAPSATMATAEQMPEKTAPNVDNPTIKTEFDADEINVTGLQSAPTGGSEDTWGGRARSVASRARTATVEDAEDVDDVPYFQRKVEDDDEDEDEDEDDDDDDEDDDEDDSEVEYSDEDWVSVPPGTRSPHRRPQSSPPQSDESDEHTIHFHELDLSSSGSDKSSDLSADRYPYSGSTKTHGQAAAPLTAVRRPDLARRGRSGSGSDYSGWTAPTDTEGEGLSAKEESEFQQVVPLDQKGRPLSFTASLRKDVPEHGAAERAVGTKFYSWKTGRDQTFRGYKLDVLDVFGARVVNVSNEIKVEVITTQHNAEGPDFRWLHAQKDVMNLDEYFAIAQSFPGLSAAESVMLDQLHGKIKADKTKMMFGGRYIERGAVVRCEQQASSRATQVTGEKAAKDDNKKLDSGSSNDGNDAGKHADKINDESGSVTAVFCSFPYLRIRKASRPASDHDCGYPEMSLLQSMYPFESSHERDSEQTACTMLEGAGGIVAVPQIWTLSFGQNLLTCAPTSLNDIRPSHLQILNPTESLSFVRYKDKSEQPFLYHFSSDTTLFEFEEAICTDKWGVVSEAGRSQSNSGVHSDFDWLPEQESSIMLNMGTKMKYVDLSPDTAPFFAWGGDATQTWPQKILKTAKSVESSLKSEVLEQHSPFQVSNTLMKYFDRPVLTDDMRMVDELTFMQGLSDLDQRLVPEPDTAILSGSVNRNDDLGSVMDSIEDFRTLLCQRELILQLKQAFASSTGLFHAFLPKGHDTELATTFWGLLTSIQQRAALLHDIAKGLLQKQPNERWVIRVDQEYIMRHSSLGRKFLQVVRKCVRCKAGRPFQSLSQAFDHLRSHQDKRSNDILREWFLLVKRTPVLKQVRVFEDVLSILTEFSSVLRGLLRQACHIRRGVQSIDLQQRKIDTPIPGWRIENAFRNFYAFVFGLEKSLYHIHQVYGKWDPAKTARLSTMVPEDHPKFLKKPLLRLGRNLELEFTAAQDELSRSHQQKIRECKAPALGLGPESMALWLKACLAENAMWDQMNAVELYQELYAILRFKASHNPRKRHLQRINVLQEEITSLLMVTERQLQCIRNASKVYNPQKHHSQAARRLFTHQKFEGEVVGFVIQKLDSQQSEFQNIFHRCGPLIERTKQSVEVNEEDSGKAIFVFTVVTVIFLPLSFVTGFLGMNTADIRSMTNTQDLFWIIALPLTVVTLSLILFVAYSGDGFKERLSVIFSPHWRRRTRYASRAMVSFSRRGDKPEWPDLINLAGNSFPSQLQDPLFTWSAPRQRLEGAYRSLPAPPSPEALASRLDRRRPSPYVLQPPPASPDLQLLQPTRFEDIAARRGALQTNPYLSPYPQPQLGRMSALQQAIAPPDYPPSYTYGLAPPPPLPPGLGTHDYSANRGLGMGSSGAIAAPRLRSRRGPQRPRSPERERRRAADQQRLRLGNRPQSLQERQRRLQLRQQAEQHARRGHERIRERTRERISELERWLHDRGIDSGDPVDDDDDDEKVAAAAWYMGTGDGGRDSRPPARPSSMPRPPERRGGTRAAAAAGLYIVDVDGGRGSPPPAPPPLMPPPPGRRKVAAAARYMGIGDGGRDSPLPPRPPAMPRPPGRRKTAAAARYMGIGDGGGGSPPPPPPPPPGRRRSARAEMGAAAAARAAAAAERYVGGAAGGPAPPPGRRRPSMRRAETIDPPPRPRTRRGRGEEAAAHAAILANNRTRSAAAAAAADDAAGGGATGWYDWSTRRGGGGGDDGGKGVRRDDDADEDDDDEEDVEDRLGRRQANVAAKRSGGLSGGQRESVAAERSGDLGYHGLGADYPGFGA